MVHVRALNRQFMTRLLDTLPENISQYAEDKSWVEKWAGNMAWDFSTPCALAAPLELLLPDKEDNFDLANAIRMHKALPNLTPVQAQDARLWTRLTHVDLWEYMRVRWPVEKYLEPEPNLRPIRDRYFVALKPHSRSLVHNGASRLWWAAKMTYDRDRDNNPYELTSVLLSKLDIYKNVLEYNFGRATGVTKTFLEFLLLNKEECLESGSKSRQLVRELSKAVNLQGGISLLDCKPQTAMTDFLEREKNRINAKLAANPESIEDINDDE